MIKKPVCEICKETEHKYRCPQCRAVYCSLPCYKIHKESCNQQEPTVQQDKDGCLTETTDLTVADLTVPDFTLEGSESEDRVSAEQLQALEKSEELKEILCNPHLRHMMTSLVHSQNPGTQLEKAMQEPIFTEFADNCLSIIDNKID